MSLSGQRILLGVTGGIAAYKSAMLCRRLKEAGAQVKVVMTKGALAFLTPLTMQAVSGEKVHTQLLDADAEAGMGHIELARWATILLFAPASADVLAKLAAGLANDLLTTLALASPAPLWLAPAMNQQMWQHPATQANVKLLGERGATLIGPDAGEQACGDVGAGRMSEPEDIVAALQQQLSRDQQRAANSDLWQGQRILITAGPTREPLDPVRYLTNRSSGKMGFALATAAQEMAAEVVLIAGPVQLATPAGVTRIDVKTAEQMQQRVMEHVPEADVFISCAAVSDYRPARMAPHKMKKSAESGLTLTLVQNPDILAQVATLKDRPWCVGFAAETTDVENYAREKLSRKKLDVICANDVSDVSMGFDSDENALWVYTADKNNEIRLGPASKSQLAIALMEHLASLKKQTGG